MSVHSRLYQLLQPEERMELQRQARVLTQQKRDAREEEVEGLMQAHELAARRSQTTLQQQGLPNYASHLKFGAEQLHILDELVSRWCNVPRKEVQDRRAAAQKPPEPPPALVVEELLSMEERLPKRPRPEPEPWVKVLCEHRHDLQGLIVGASFEMNEIVYRFLYASQNPRRAVLSGAALHDLAGLVLRRHRTIAPLTEYIDHCRPRLFEVLVGTYSSHLDLIIDEEGGGEAASHPSVSLCGRAPGGRTLLREAAGPCPCLLSPQTLASRGRCLVPCSIIQLGHRESPNAS